MAMQRDQEPKDSEYSHGRGLMPPTSLADPSGYEQMRAIYAMDSTDASATPNYEGLGYRTDKGVTIPVRETGTPTA